MSNLDFGYIVQAFRIVRVISVFMNFWVYMDDIFLVIQAVSHIQVHH